MALRHWTCKICQEATRTFTTAPVHCDVPMELQLSAPNAKMMEPRKAGSTSVLKDQTKMLRARSREHARDFELDELIANNPKHISKANQWVTDKGRKRTRIDDI